MTQELAADERLPPEAASAGLARRLVRQALAGPGREDLLDAAQVAVSEIVTNALVHAGTSMRLRVLLSEEVLRVELADGSPRLPRVRSFAPSAATGRGLRLVEDLVTRWGAHAAPAGKVVWFEISELVPQAAEATEAAPEPRPAAGEADAVRVELHEMPLLMHQAWQEHAAALLRELMLVRLDAELDALTEHARASDALGVLQEQVPAPYVGRDPESVMANATGTAVSARRLVVAVPRRSLASFEALDVLMDEAIQLADEGSLLAPPTQPEIEEMRRWICEQVRRQAADGGASPWRSLPAAAPPARAALPASHWDPRAVTASDAAVLAADDANRIVAVSSSALELLGYDHADDLVGRRLLSIIPERFHQAHVAGFTLFLVNGRDPLLDTEVTVPVLRRDGREVDRTLLIRARSLPEGRHLFIADLSA